jgi:hypothetical protein
MAIDKARFYYSPKLNGFFHGSVSDAHGIKWPEDAALVTDEVFSTFTGEAPDGKELGPDPEGQPIWVDSITRTGYTLLQQVANMKAWAQALLDTTAQTYGYDNMLTAVSYAGDPLPAVAAEGDAMKAWRSLVWSVANPTINDVLNGRVVVPLKSAFIASLPVYVPPAGSQPVQTTPAAKKSF